jgi:uncharacterized circularly permuted ATP-grasp superfamily protein
MGFDDHPYSEERDEAGAFRPGYAQLFKALQGVDLSRLSADVNDHLASAGVNFGTEPFIVDPVPRLIDGAEWEPLVDGLVQRAHALNRFLIDAYREQRIVEAGLVPADVLHEAVGFEPDLEHRLPDTAYPAAIIGFDVVRAPDGEFLVLEDNLRTPSGFEYALAARRALAEALPAGFPKPRPTDPITYELLDSTLRAAAPPGVADPSMVVLTDGPHNVAYCEHSRAAAELNVPLVTLDQLEADGERLRARLGDGAVRDVDVVYRRSNEDRVRDEHGQITEVAQVLVPPWLAGNLGLVNAFGNGLADDKLIHAHVEDFIRFYLKAEPLVRSVPTYGFVGDDDEPPSKDRFRGHVVKPRHGHGGKGVVIGSRTPDHELEELATEVARDPGSYISQPTVSLSRHPTVIEGELEPRHIDLRAFAFCGEQVRLMPGGLSRVALEKDKLVVNSSQAGGGKDTWIVG